MKKGRKSFKEISGWIGKNENIELMFNQKGFDGCALFDLHIFGTKGPKYEWEDEAWPPVFVTVRVTFGNQP